MFASERQQAAVCRALLGTVHKPHLWGVDGPTDEAVDLLEQNGGYLSSGERVMLLVAFDVWNGGGHASLADVLNTLDASRRAKVAQLMLSLHSSTRIDEWLVANGAGL